MGISPIKSIINLHHVNSVSQHSQRITYTRKKIPAIYILNHRINFSASNKIEKIMRIEFIENDNKP